MSRNIAILDDANFDEKLAEYQQPILVDFWAEWCGPCKMIAPALEEIAAEYDSISIAKVNVDDSPDLARRFQIMSIPTLLLFDKGEPVQRLVGAKPKAALVKELEAHL